MAHLGTKYHCSTKYSRIVWKKPQWFVCDNYGMKQSVSNLIPKCEGKNITAEQIVDVVDNINFISFVATNPWYLLAEVKEVSNWNNN